MEDFQIILQKCTKGTVAHANLATKVQHGWHFVQRESALEMKCLSTGPPARWSPIAECAPSRPRNMRSVQNVAECLVCRLTPLVSPQRKPIDLIYAFTRGYNRGLVHDNSCFCCFFENEFEISQTAPTVTSFPPSLPHTFWSRLGMILGLNAAGMKTRAFPVLTTM